MTLEDWLSEEEKIAESRLVRSISPPGALPGAVLASPSRDPDYAYDWLRDSGITMKAMLLRYHMAREPGVQQRYLKILLDYAGFSKIIQKNAVHEGVGLGEPKFTVQGMPYKGLWARPQDDGPAIRAIELTGLAFLLLDLGREDLVRAQLYDGRWPSQAVIKVDLEYIVQRWREPSYDLWEEVWGHHFWTKLLQRKALMGGIALATRLGDKGAAQWYQAQAQQLGNALTRHWNPARGYLVATIDPDPLWKSGLDSSVIIASLGGASMGEMRADDVFPVDHEQVLATAAVQEEVFGALYPINDPARRIPGIAIGRYPEDRYDGYRTDQRGNPWPGLTLGFAWYYYELCRRYRSLGTIPLTAINLRFFQRLTAAPLRAGEELVARAPRFEELLRALFRRGDAFVERVRAHVNPDGSMSEQMNRSTGIQQGAADLSMGYAALLFAAHARRMLSR